MLIWDRFDGLGVRFVLKKMVLKIPKLEIPTLEELW